MAYSGAIPLLIYWMLHQIGSIPILKNTNIDFDGDHKVDVQIHQNTNHDVLVFKNHVYRKGITKYIESVDISDINIIKERILRDKEETNSLKDFDKVKKKDLPLLCPNFEGYNNLFVDDIKDPKFELHDSVRVVHGEHSPASDGHRFIVTMYRSENQSVCQFEYSEYQKHLLQLSAFDARNPYTYHEQEEYINFQSASMHNIHTHEECAKRGVVVKDSEDVVINMTNTNFFEDRLVGRASCARLCYSRNSQYEFIQENPSLEVKCSEKDCFLPHACKFWSFVPDDNLCYLHPKIGPQDEVSTYYRRAGSVYGAETYRDYTSINGEVGCLDKLDTSKPFILIGDKYVGVIQLCSYIHSGTSDLHKTVHAQCYQDFLHRQSEQNKEQEKLDQIDLLLETNIASRSKRFASTLLKVATQIPSIVQWVTNIIKSAEGSPQMLSPTAPRWIFDSFTLDTREMFNGLVKGLLPRFSPQFVLESSGRKQNLDIQNNWNIEVQSLNIEILKKTNKTLNKDYILSDKLENNLSWKLRSRADQKELSELVKLTETAKKYQNPLTDAMTSKLKGQPFVFASQTLKEGPTIQRMFLVTEPVKNYPDIQYLALGVQPMNNITEGHVLSGSYQSSDVKLLSCFAALAADELMENDCYNQQRTKIQQLKEFTLFTQSTSAIIIRVIVDKETLQILCRSKADVIYGLGIVIVVIARDCTIRLGGHTIRAGEDINQETDMNGFYLVYNGKIKEGDLWKTMDTQIKEKIDEINQKIVDMQKEESKDTELQEELDRLSHKLETIRNEQYELGPYVDMIMTAVVSGASFGMVLYKFYLCFCRPKETQN